MIPMVEFISKTLIARQINMVVNISEVIKYFTTLFFKCSGIFSGSIEAIIYRFLDLIKYIEQIEEIVKSTIVIITFILILTSLLSEIKSINSLVEINYETTNSCFWTCMSV